MTLRTWTASRRRFLAGLTVGPASLVSHSAQSAPSGDATAGSDETVCALTPQSVEGPYYVDPKLVRADITEDRQGIPLRLRLRVIEAGPCTPIAGARIDIWHCDARGLYSGYPGQGDDRSIDTSGQTFLRGTQMTDAAGYASFDTLYPGWYAGRATHIHFKTFLDQQTVLMGQIYLPDALNEFIYANVPAYTGRSVERSVVNANDGIATEQDPNRRAFCAIKEERDRYLASLTLGVDRRADARGEERALTGTGRPERPGPGFPPPPGAAPPSGFRPPPGGPPNGRPPPGFAGPPQMTLKDRLAALIPGFDARRSKQDGRDR